MIKRRKILLFLCLALSILNVSKVYGSEGGEGNVSTVGGSNDQGGAGSGTGGGNGGTGGNGQYSPWTYFDKDGKKYKYRYSVQYGSSINHNIAYKIPTGNVIKSGTWVGINIHEIQSASWNVTATEFKEIKKVYTCTEYKENCSYITERVPAGYNSKGERQYVEVKRKKCNPHYDYTIEDEVHDYYEQFSCPKDNVMTVKEHAVTTDEVGSKLTEIYELAHSRAAGMVGVPLSKVQIITDELNKKNEHKTETILGNLVSSSDSGAEKSGTITKTYSYKPSSICMNLKTGKVRYNKECKQDEEVKINPYIYKNTEYWQYFSPLDTKSGTNFSLVVKNNADRKLSAGECHSIMNNYKDGYQNRIVSINNKALNGDYCKNGNCNNLNTGSGSDWQEVSKGCYFSTVLNFDVVQKYYYEEMKKNELKFNGYNLYYRPININNPFPTTPTENSIWYEWFNSTSKTPNLKDSFNEVTYSVAVPNKLADTIRAYNVNNPYPSFDKLSLNGTSSFLQSIGVVSLTGDKVNKLGEGTKTCIKNGTVSIGSDCS